MPELFLFMQRGSRKIVSSNFSSENLLFSRFSLYLALPMKSLSHKQVTRIILLIGVVGTIVIVPVLINVHFSGTTEIFASWDRYANAVYFGVSYGLLFWLGNWGIGVFTGRRLDWYNNPNRSNFVSLLAFILFGFFASIIVPFVIFKYIHHSTGRQFFNNVVFNAFIAFSIDMIVISIYYSRYLVQYWKKSIERTEVLEKEALIAKYEALKNQVNPHFLFNSLNTLAGVVEQNPDKAVQFIKKLSDIYRYVLEQRGKEIVTLEEELKFVDDYIFLAKLRYGEGLHYQASVQSRSKYIIPLGLQILVENCIKHNVIDDDNPLSITIKEELGYIITTNNLQKKSSVIRDEKIGLENLRKRYIYLSEKPLLISDNAKKFTVKIPIIENLD
jgi:two-component system LytT family sensor kinase